MNGFRGNVWLALLLAPGAAQAATIETVRVGNPGTILIDYTYRIGKYEVTNSQYSEFLNGVDPRGRNILDLYNTNMSTDPVGGIDFNDSEPDGSKYETKSGFENKPVVYVSWYDAIRFINWLQNGQGNGDTETGTYVLGGGTPTPVGSGTLGTNDQRVTLKPDTWDLPHAIEWTKAGFHKNDGVTGNYWDYATGSDSLPTAESPVGGNNSANYDDAVGTVTNVGAYSNAPSPYGTFDQAGNVWEWTLTIFDFESDPTVAGGSWFTRSRALTSPSGGTTLPPDSEYNTLGFRVAYIPIPEPSALMLGGLALVGLAMRKHW